jgi:hypothetical protein
VAFLSARVGWPAGCSSFASSSTASWDDNAPGENRALTMVTVGDGGILGVVTLLKASPMESLSTQSCYFRGNRRSGSPGSDDGGALVSLSLLGSSFLDQLLVGGGKRWSGVHLSRPGYRVSEAWRNRVSLTEVP